jgi:hypothetical protein
VCRPIACASPVRCSLFDVFINVGNTKHIATLKDKVELRLASLKGVHRGWTKVLMEYSGNVNKLTDLVRMTFTCGSLKVFHSGFSLGFRHKHALEDAIGFVPLLSHHLLA